jgi:endoglucanase
VTFTISAGVRVWAAVARYFPVACAVAIWVAAGPARVEPVKPLRLTGVNIAGAEFGHKAIPGRPGHDYFFPSRPTIDHFAGKGMNTLRIPFLWERVQRTLGEELHGPEVERINAVVNHATAKGMHVILDVHNYAAYRRKPIGTADVSPEALADLWGRLAARYKNNDRVIFGLMNEPKGLPTETWLAAANAAIAAIRQTGATNLILIPGNGWTGAHSWLSSGYGTPNGETMLGIVDPRNNHAYEVHQYLDADFSGTKPQCRNEKIGAKALTAFTGWLRKHNKRGFLGEFGAGSDPVCMTALDGMLRFMSDNSDVWLGWTYWAAGPWPRSYFTSVQPVDGTDPPQMDVLLKYLAPKTIAPMGQPGRGQ